MAADALDPAARAAHDAAELRGEAGYLDPASGLFVLTATALRDRGTCCGNGCRHCPYDGSDADGDGGAGDGRRRA